MAESTSIKRSAVDSLAGKLESFAKTLPEQEQNVLGWILSRTQETSGAELSDDQLETVAGGQSSPMARQLAESVGFDGQQIQGESEITVGWKYKF
jgi:uncharacterized protein YgiM (DUF1202 family)